MQGQIIEIGDRVVFQKGAWFFSKRGIVVGENGYKIAIRRLFRTYILDTRLDYIVAYKRKSNER